MKTPEYREGPDAQRNFEEGMKALFNVPKDEVVKAEKKKGKYKTSSRVQSVRKRSSSDKVCNGATACRNQELDTARGFRRVDAIDIQILATPYDPLLKNPGSTSVISPKAGSSPGFQPDSE